MKKTWEKMGETKKDDLHVTHGAGFTVKKRLWRHPFDWKTSLCETKNKWTIINKNMRKCKELPDQNRKKKKINVFFIALQMYVTLPVMSARKCHPLHHAQVQSQKFCTLGSRQRECYEQPNHDGRPKKKKKQTNKEK